MSGCDPLQWLRYSPDLRGVVSLSQRTVTAGEGETLTALLPLRMSKLLSGYIFKMPFFILSSSFPTLFLKFSLILHLQHNKDKTSVIEVIISRG